MTQSITIKPNEVKSVKLIISAKKIGFITLSLTAVGNSAGDKIKERLKIIPEGVEQNINSATTIQLKDGKTKDNKALTCVLPPNTVLDTVTVSASVVGDIIGGSMKNIDSLIRIPSGCGEQNMIIATPNALALIYLTITGQLTPEITAQGINNLLTGYQAQLTYKLDDGSFSAFGPSDGNGSTWLTAYVVKSFIQFQQFITIDQAVIDRALVFVVSKQQTDGSFIENGRVIHKDMQGAAGDGLAFTCYMTIVLKTSLPDHPQYSVEIQKALTYIIRKLSSSNDIYELLVCSYALKFNNNPAANGFKAKILALGTSTTSELHWDKSSSTGEAGSLSIEMTAYGLLYFLLDKDSGTSFRILKWLISQQNSYGGFKSTQDTVVAFQAISQIALGFRATSTNLDLIMKPNVGRTYNAHVDKSNALTQQDFAVSFYTKSEQYDEFNIILA